MREAKVAYDFGSYFARDTQSSMYPIFSAIRNFAMFSRSFVRGDAAHYYELLGDDVIEGETEGFTAPGKPLWLNLGYWERARTYPEAARALAEQLAEAAELGPSDVLLDVGFGFAEQDLLWIEKYDVAHITGLNITAMQVQRARERIALRGLQERITLGMGSATQMPFAGSTFSKVTALESAFHFDTREQFFQEAFRVLKPGGRLALADGVPAVGSPSPSWKTKMILRHWAAPLANYYDLHEYKRKLQACGFVNICCRTITEHVIPGTVWYSDLRRSGTSVEAAIIPELSRADVEAARKRWSRFGLTEYVIVTADKAAS